MNYPKTMKKALKASFCILLALANSCSGVHFDEAAPMTEIRLSGKVEVLSKATGNSFQVKPYMYGLTGTIQQTNLFITTS